MENKGKGSKNSPRIKLGNMTITNRGYGGGKKMEKLIGAEKVKGPKVK